VGTELRGHEFRYSKVLEWRGSEADMVFGMRRGTGFAGDRDGIRSKRVFATCTHIHALGVPGWAPALVANARAYRDGSPIRFRED
jgi:cobyrinic acid a,c-diamide synthase